MATMRRALSALRRLSAATHLPAVSNHCCALLISLAFCAQSWSCRVHCICPCYSGVEFVRWVPGRWGPFPGVSRAVPLSWSLSVFTTVPLGTPCARTHWAGSQSSTLPNLTQTKCMMALYLLHSVPWDLGWIRTKGNIFTMASKLPSKHSNLGFPQVWPST